jgi:acylglycerol lipase
VFTLDQRGWGKTATDPKEKSPSSSYGKTSFDSQMEDLDFFINHEKSKIREGLPVFLMGQSMV